METFFFGHSAHSLYGAYHPPRANVCSNKAVLICGPIAQEAIRLHKAMRFLATQLSDAGYHVLRFDYRGQGDSAGDMSGVTPAQWQADISVALQELADISMATDISLLGIRIGGLLSGTLSPIPPKVKRLLLWDPWVQGEDCREDLLALGNMQPDNQQLAVNGCLIPVAFLEQLSDYSLLGVEPERFSQVELVVSHERDIFSTLAERLGLSADRGYCLTPTAHDWNYVDNESGILWPITIMQSLLQKLRS